VRALILYMLATILFLVGITGTDAIKQELSVKAFLMSFFGPGVSRSAHAAGDYVKVRTFVGPQNPVGSVPGRAPRANRSH